MELVFLMVILKIPIAYLCSVVYYAIKAEPRKGRGDAAGSGLARQPTARIRQGSRPAAPPSAAPARRPRPCVRPHRPDHLRARG